MLSRLAAVLDVSNRPATVIPVEFHRYKGGGPTETEIIVYIFSLQAGQ